MKMKSHSGTKKRVRKTATGKMKVDKASHNHLLLKKSKSAKRGFRRGYDVPKTMEGAIAKLLPHS